MQLEENKSLKDYNTFGIDCKARYFVSVETISELKQILSEKPSEALFILGGGSNMLLTGDLNAFVLHINLKGIEIISETETEVLVKAMAGENWHGFVEYCIKKDFGGLENLSLIPGNVGTAPIQNIGAYGVELKDTFESCNTLEIETLKERKFSKDECAFEYRNSIFKNEVKGKYIITSVTFRLTKKNHKTSISYGDIQKNLAEKNIKNPDSDTLENSKEHWAEKKVLTEKDIEEINSLMYRIMTTAELKRYSSFIVTAELANLLSNEKGPFMVFAPSNTAIESLSAERIKFYSTPDNKPKLQEMLKSHIVQGSMNQEALLQEIKKSGKAKLTTVEGITLTASKSGDNIVISDGKEGKGTVIKADISGSNGVLYVIDGILNAN